MNYKNTESLRCIPETGIVNQLYLNKNRIQLKKIFFKQKKKKVQALGRGPSFIPTDSLHDPWASYLTFRGLGFLLYKVEITAPASQGNREGETIHVNCLETCLHRVRAH